MKPEPTKLNLVLILTGGYGFPFGDAYTNRILAFASGFVKNGCKVTILIIYPGRQNTLDRSGSMDGFDYIFCTPTKRPTNPIVRKIFGFRGIINSIRILKHLDKDKTVDGIITFSQNFLQNFPIYLFTRQRHIPLIRENNEFPKRIIKRGHSKLKLAERIFFRFVNRFFDGYIFISSGLVDYNRSLLPKEMPILVVPIIVDAERFNFTETDGKKWVTYCGNLFGEKDGVKILIEAFAKIHKNHPEYKLVLIGNNSNQIEFDHLKSQITKFGIVDKVHFTGFIHRDKVPALLAQSSLLVLARPDNIQAKGGFPTKLGEYLATGRPVLVTAVGDIPKYIHHGVNGFLAKSGSADDFAEKLDWIIKNYEKADRIALNGKRLTEQDFDNVKQAARIIDFISSIKLVSLSY